MKIQNSLLVLFFSHVSSLLVTTLKDVPEDALLDVPRLALKYDGVYEEHDVITDDGYILSVFRLPGDASRPVLLLHGLLGSCADYMIRGNTSLAFSLHRAGYDVWLWNIRGNRYSRRHLTLNPDLDRSFWDFTFHDHGVYDLASTIDYALQKTRQRKLRLIGFSQGTFATFALLSTRPKYNDKINVFVALGPVALLNDLPSPMKEGIQYQNVIYAFLSMSGTGELAGYYSTLRTMIVHMCFERSMAYHCLNDILFPIVGADPYEFEEEFVPVLFSHLGLGTSLKNLKHQSQIAAARRFQLFDYGPVENLSKYRSVIPPSYDLSKVTVDTFIIHASNDKLSTPKNVATLKKLLPNVINTYRMPTPSSNHLGILQGRTEHKLVVKHVIDILSRYN